MPGTLNKHGAGRRILGWAAALLVGATVLTACSRDQDPWTRHSDQLEQERERSPAQAHELRERAQRVQGAF